MVYNNKQTNVYVCSMLNQNQQRKMTLRLTLLIQGDAPGAPWTFVQLYVFMNPRSEQNSFRLWNIINRRLCFRYFIHFRARVFCRFLQPWNSRKSIDIHGLTIDRRTCPMESAPLEEANRILQTGIYNAILRNASS